MNSDPTIIWKAGQTAELDLCTVNSRVVFDCAGYEAWVFQLDKPGYAWATSAVVTLEWSMDGLVWVGLSSAITTNAYGIIDTIPDISAIRRISLRTSTLGSGTSPYPVNVTGYGVPR